ncbi:hypothetical protein CHLRE_06g278111v5 [Chlamydomonas reinhardtii]|uniref:Cyclic nucleotide-binding domain-containing protein n=1 Tax=Chlamydomonas reinhardtii TaxID=3055 RepID=A0A2K3DNV4_CHLRE|nr:uncharacterized protein CHLRE_06g278111v5 [Chlamydomonas reinhardtii]PNW82219.1 hypothetical protein CHLRE_06g278111v5 [Chlamydomonas reinhardtii]
MPTMSWNRVDGFEGNETRLGATSLGRNSTEKVPVLSDIDYQYSDYYKPKTRSSKELQADDLELVDLRDGDGMRAFQDEQHHTQMRKRKQWVILPDSRFRKMWINVQLFVVLYIIWVTPVRVGFDKPATGFWFWFEGLIDFFFYTDLVLNFFTAYEHPVTGELITNHKKIALRYLRTWFVVDLLATFPSDYVIRGIEGTWGCSISGNCDLIITNDSAASLIVMLRLLRIFRILWIFKNFNVLSISTVLGKIQDEFYAARWVVSLLELLIVLVYLGHLSGCFFYLFSGPRWYTNEERRLINEGELTTWVMDKMGGYYQVVMPNRIDLAPDGTKPTPSDLIAQDPATGYWYMCPDFYFMVACPKCDQLPQLRCKTDFSFPYRYITSMYWAYTTMTTVGYGDIYGTTIAEKIWCMFTMVIGGFFLSFCFGRMASIVSRLDADKVARGEQLHELSAFMKDVELPRPLARKVLTYFKKQKVRAYDRQAVLARLPFELRAKILRHLYLPTIANVPLLQAMSEDDVFLTDLCVRLQPTHFSADTFVYMRGESGADVFILLQGELQVLAADQRTVLYVVPEVTVFGEGSVLRQLAQEQQAAVAADASGEVGVGTEAVGTKIKRRENVFCKSPCDMLRLPEEDIKDLCEHYPALWRGLRKLDLLRQARIQERLAELKEQSEHNKDSDVAAQETSSLLRGAGGAAAGTPSAHGGLGLGSKGGGGPHAHTHGSHGSYGTLMMANSAGSGGYDSTSSLSGMAAGLGIGMSQQQRPAAPASGTAASAFAHAAMNGGAAPAPAPGLATGASLNGQ